MISSKLLRGLPNNKQYIIYDNICTYILEKHKDNTFHLYQHGWTKSGNIYIFEKDYESLLIEASYADDDKHWFLKYEYLNKGYTNKWGALSSVGMVSLHSDFSFYKLKYFGEYKGEDTIKELNRFKKVFKVR